MRTVQSLLALTLVASSQLACAFMDSPALVTANPVPGEPVFVSINAGVCDAITSDPIEVERTGNNVQMVVPTVHSDFSDYCIFPTGALALEVGTFSAGAYSLKVYRRYYGSLGPVTTLLGTLEFTVTAPTPVPALGWPSLFALTLLLVAAAHRSIVPPNNSFKRTAATGCGTIMRCAAAAA